MCLLQFFDDVTRLEDHLRQLTSSVDTIDEQQHVGLDVSEQLIRQIQVGRLTNAVIVSLLKIYKQQISRSMRRETFLQYFFAGKFVFMYRIELLCNRLQPENIHVAISDVCLHEDFRGQQPGR